jgi:tetratricopeptide (TPR) repeat protein
MKGYNLILKKLVGKLTGDIKKDVAALRAQAKVHEFDEEFRKIIMPLNNLLTDLIPGKNSHKKFPFTMEDRTEEIEFQMYKKNFDKALQLARKLVEEINLYYHEYLFEDIANNHCYFDNALEYAIFFKLCEPGKDTLLLGVNISRPYFLLGSLLIHFNEFDVAKSALEMAHKISPTRTDILFKLVEIYKHRKDWDNYLALNKQASEYVYTRQDAAKINRNLGYYYHQQQSYKLAMALYSASIYYDYEARYDSAGPAMMEISLKTGIPLKLEFEEIEQLLKKNNTLFEIDPIMVDLADDIIINANAKKDYATAREMTQILYNLSPDESIKKELEELDEKIKLAKKQEDEND